MAYNGQLNQNEIFSAIYNMIISQEVFADNLGKHLGLVDNARVDGGLMGDTKLYYATDVLKSAAWGKDAEAANLLTLFRPKAPNCQAIKLNQFRQIAITIDNYMSKRAFADEGTFGQFNAVMLGWLGETKRMYDNRLYACYIGSTVTTTGKQNQTVTLTGTNDGQAIANKIATILVDLGDYNTAYNDLGYTRSYAEQEINVVWNAKYVNKILKLDTPTIFHRDGLVDKLDKYVLPARYFGINLTTTNVSTYAAATATTGKPLQGAAAPYTYVPGTANANGCVRTRVECDITVGATTTHLFPGDELPANASVVTTAGTGKILLTDCYIEDEKVICKIMTKLPPLMSAFEVGTNFFNGKALVETHYLTWGYNDLQYFVDKPFITLKQA